MKKYLTLIILLFASVCLAGEPIQLARMSPAIVGGGVSAAAPTVVTVDAAYGVQWTGSTTYATTVSWSHTCAANANVLFVGCGLAGNVGKVTGVTYNGVSFPAAVWDAARLGVLNSSGWILANPASGTNTVEVTFASATDAWNGTQGCGSVSFIGANASTPYGTPVTDNEYGTTPTVTVTTTANSIVVDGLKAAVGYPATVGVNQTKQYKTGEDTEIGYSTQSGADGGVMSWSIGTGHWVTGAVSINP